MNAARIAILGIVVTALTAGILLYYLQIFAYYTDVNAEQAGGVDLVNLSTGAPEPLVFDAFQGIDSDSSPIRYRACFTTPLSQAMLTETYVMYAGAEPLVAPPWFDCFDAEALGAALQTGEALAFLSAENITYGVDRVVAILPDGRGFAWHQINDCGAVVFSGEPAPDGCPPVPEGLR
jgi:hypothetical protein